ncbi:MAG: ribosome maturation factor RimM [Gammaproteobacteria bacterium SG8_11]|nr:MAG: ribosome maturation factor RimM [Gammaproteobacteria bacterium SG8_11]
MVPIDQEFVVVGKISTPYGIKGWVKLFSYTDPIENILQYQPWFINHKGVWKKVAIEQGRIHGKTLVAHIEAVEDRDSAEQFKGCEIAIQRSQLPAAEPGEYYWIDLIGLRVINQQGIELGVVDHLMETGANDVLVIRDKKQDNKGGDKERLIPFVLNEFIKSVDLDTKTIHVDWDADF